MTTLTTEERVSRLKSQLVAPYVLKKEIKVKVAADVSEAKAYVERGWCPIECSSGKHSAVDELQLDHHGRLSDLEGVAIRGYRDFYGARVDDPRIVVLGFPDEDATFCAAALLGQLPHPLLAEVFPDQPEAAHLVMTQNLSHLAELINRVDIDKEMARELDDTQAGRIMVLWRQIGHPTRSNEPAWWGGIDRWTNLLTQDLRLAHSAATELAQDQLDKVLATENVTYGKSVSVADFTSFGKNSVLYNHWLQNKTPVLVAYFADLGQCSFAVRDMDWATKNLGTRGLLSVYGRLGPGAGGREVLGGSSRMLRLTWDEAKKLGEKLAGIIESE